MNKFITLFGFTILAMCLMVGCSKQADTKDESSPETKETVQEDQEESQDQEEVQETTVEEPKDEPKDEGKAAKVGETVNVEGIKVTLTGIEPYTGEIEPFQPLYKDHAVKIGFIIENTTQKKAYVTEYEFTMYDTEGSEIQLAVPVNEQHLSGDIAAGKKLKGAIYFDVPDQEGIWKVRYSSFSNFGENATWEVPAK